jgi:hypothetical protein
LEVVFKTITVHYGDTQSYLDMDITFIGDKVDLTMKGYVDQLLQQYYVITSVNSPVSNDLFIIHSDSTLLNGDLRLYFHSAVAK